MPLLSRFVALVTLLLLLVAMFVGLGPNASTRLVQLGEATWPGYASELRELSAAPTCDPAELRERLKTCGPGAAAPEPLPDDPFAEPAPKPAPAEVDPFAEPAANTPAPKENCAALQTLADRCDVRWAEHDEANRRRTGAVAAFATVDGWVSSVAKFPWSKHLLVLLVLAGGLATSVHRAHLVLREPEHVHEFRVAHGAQLLAWCLWLASCIADGRVQAASSAETEHAALPWLWAAGFTVLALVEIVHLLRPVPLKGSFSPLRAVLCIPLYAWMACIAGAWFLLGEQHSSGQAIFLHKFVQIPSIYLGIGLYIWAGMLLSQTRLAASMFDVLLPWKLPPALLGWLVVVLAALPTAYSGASGIFVIAAGAVIFERLVAAGSPPRLAMAATAMSGSLGVVLRPCLVVVLVAVLDSDVTSAELFGWGRWVFALTAGLFLVAMLWRNDQPFVRPVWGEAFSASGSAARTLLPAAVIGIVGLLFYWLVLGTTVTEHTAALVLPGLMLALALWDRLQAKAPVWSALVEATSTASHHIGALLFVMAGSVGIGGVVERSEVMGMLPEDLGGPWPAMAILVVAMVLVGMTMDALGAVILVSVSLTHVADANGIQPAHFWMMVLCAFELGYLTPPVALNHLLARQVIGPAAEVDRLPASSWTERYEHILLPMGVMASALVLVAFVPLLFY